MARTSRPRGRWSTHCSALDPCPGADQAPHIEAAGETRILNVRPDTLDFRDHTATASGAQHHGDFDDDPATVRATLARILGTASVPVDGLRFHRSASSLRDRRLQLVYAPGAAM